MRMLFSIIMPVYNAETFLSRSIASLFAQTYSEWELLCVDDGSSDDSLKVLRDYEKSDNRIRVFSQENKGPAQARALAIQRAQGDYLIYLDSDDEFSDDLIQKAFKTIQKTGADIILPNLYSEKADGSWIDGFVKAKLVANGLLSSNEAFVRSLNWDGVHSFFFIKTAISRQIACAPENMYNNFNADEYITRVLLLSANQIALCSGRYYYKYNGESITKRHSAKIYNYLQTNQKLIEFAKSKEQLQSVVTSIELRAFQEMIDLLLIYYTNKKSLKKKERVDIRGKFKSYYSLLDKTKLIYLLDKKGITQKFQIVLLFRNYRLFKLSVYGLHLLSYFPNKLYRKAYNKLYPLLSPDLLSLLDLNNN